MANAIIQTLSRLLNLLQPELTQPQAEVVLSVAYYGLLRGYRLSSLNWMVGQSWLESAYMTDAKALDYNNPFGMSRVYVRPTNQLGYVELSDGNSFGTYASIKDAVQDRFDWDDWQGIKQSDYAKQVSKKYNESADYQQAVSAVSVKGVGVAIGLLLGLIPFSYLLIKSLL